MSRFTLPRDLYHGKGTLETLKTLEGKKAFLVVGGGSMKRFGFLDKAVGYLKDAGMEVALFEGVESDPSVDTVLRGAKAMQEFAPAVRLSMPQKQCGYSMNIRIPNSKICAPRSASRSCGQRQSFVQCPLPPALPQK